MAFENALHLFPLDAAPKGHDLIHWNSNTLWRSDYDDMAVGYFFFAQDIFGEQFSLWDEQVWRFDPETGHSQM